MVSTRSQFSPSSARPSTSPSTPADPPPPSTSPKAPSPASKPKPWTHTPTNLTLVWLLASLPLVIWDTLYVFLRPHSMPGGFLHSPLWVPYALYGTVDHVYGFRAWEAKNGFTAAQSLLNAVETVAYGCYLWGVWRFGREENGAGEGAKRLPGRPRKDAVVRVVEEVRGWRVVEGRAAGRAVLVGFAASVMTLSKTVLYCESCSLDSSLLAGTWAAGRHCRIGMG